MKRFYKILLQSLLKIAPLVLFIMLMAPACKKTKVEPTPEPQHYNVVIDWNWDVDVGLAPPMDTIRKYTNNQYVDTVFINLTYPNATTFLPRHFRKAHDTLQTRIDLAPEKVWGKGGIYVNSQGGAQLPGYDVHIYGMALPDSVWFTGRGWAVKRL